eukprot:3777138-Pyramimonas_sp.AAC.1
MIPRPAGARAFVPLRNKKTQKGASCPPESVAEVSAPMAKRIGKRAAVGADGAGAWKPPARGCSAARASRVPTTPTR